MLCDYVLGGMKCGITDMSAGSSDMVDSLRIWFTYRSLIGIKSESLELFGQEVRMQPRGGVVRFAVADVEEQVPPLFFNRIYAVAVSVRGRPAEAREH